MRPIEPLILDGDSLQYKATAAFMRECAGRFTARFPDALPLDVLVTDKIAVLPAPIMRWLRLQEGCPEELRDMLDYALDDDAALGELPTWKDLGVRSGGHVRVTGRTGGRVTRNSRKGWLLDLAPDPEEFGTFFLNARTGRVASGYMPREEDMLAPRDEDDWLVGLERKSLRGVIRFILSQELPVGKLLLLHNRTDGSTLEILVTA